MAAAVAERSWLTPPNQRDALYVAHLRATCDQRGRPYVELQFRHNQQPLPETCPNERCPGLPAKGEQVTTNDLLDVLQAVRGGKSADKLDALIERFSTAQRRQQRGKQTVEPVPLTFNKQQLPHCEACGFVALPEHKDLAYVSPSLLRRPDVLRRVLVNIASLQRARRQEMRAEAQQRSALHAFVEASA